MLWCFAGISLRMFVHGMPKRQKLSAFQRLVQTFKRSFNFSAERTARPQTIATVAALHFYSPLRQWCILRRSDSGLFVCTWALSCAWLQLRFPRTQLHVQIVFLHCDSLSFGAFPVVNGPCYLFERSFGFLEPSCMYNSLLVTSRLGNNTWAGWVETR